MDETFALINMGEYEEALERFIWFHNHAVDQGLTINASRLSFGLGYWIDFGKKYPPAIDALKQIRDDNTNSILNGVKTCDLFSELESINRYLSEEHKTIALFTRIDKEQPELASRCWVYFQDLAIDNDEKYFIDKYIHDLKHEYDEVEDQFITTMRILSKDSSYARLISITKESYKTDVHKFLRIAKKNNNMKTANYISHKYDVISKEYDLH